MLAIAYLPRSFGAMKLQLRWLPFRQTIQCLVEIGERNTRAICVANDVRPIGCQTRDSECHCDPVISMRLNLRTAQFSRAPSREFQFPVRCTAPVPPASAVHQSRAESARPQLLRLSARRPSPPNLQRAPLVNSAIPISEPKPPSTRTNPESRSASDSTLRCESRYLNLGKARLRQ